jgi:hypothetical protein
MRALGGHLGLAGFYLGEHASDISRLAHSLGLAGAVIAAIAVISVVIYAFRRTRVNES